MEKRTIIGELNRLMNEQMNVLKSKLNREGAIEYAMRSARIEELIALLNEEEEGQ